MSAFNAVVEWSIRNRAASAVIGVLLVLLLVTQCGGREGRTPDAAGPTPDASVTTGGPDVSPSSIVSPPPSSPSPRASLDDGEQSDAQRVATRFVRAWLSKSGSHKQWLAGMEPYTSGDLIDGYADERTRDDVPDAGIDGEPQQILDGPALTRWRFVLGGDGAVIVEVSRDEPGTERVTSIYPEIE